MKGLFCMLVIFRIVHLQTALLEKEEWYTEVITLKQGDIRGKVVKPKKNSYLSEVEVYLGIPYAAPPIGNLRFMPPGAALQWNGILNAFHMKPVCPQMLPNLDSLEQKKMSPERNNFIKKMKQYLKTESEDCLYLNIYVPRSQSREEMRNRNYAVILFIHGESFEWNSGNLYDGSVIASYGKVIFVTINFRLGVFGFLKQGLMAGRANFGLSDQIAALQWIKGNIAEFGGDPSKVTVLGHGTGAACVNFLMLSPVAEGLFHRAILMSGSALSDWALSTTSLHYIQLAGELNCSSENITYCLQKKRKDDIVEASRKFESPPFENTFTPVVDEVVVLNSPAEHMEKYSLFSKYDLMAGVSEIESYYLLEDAFLKFGLLTSEGSRTLETYTKSIYKKNPDTAFMKVIEKYFLQQRDTSALKTRNTVLEALSDMLVTAPLLQTIRYHAVTPKNTYFYVFGHHTATENTIKINRSVCGDDLPYLLGVPLDGASFHYQSEYNTQEEHLSETFIRYFTNFAKSGNPNTQNYEFLTFTSHSDFKQYVIKWPSYNLDKQFYMHFGTPPQVRQRYREEYDRFWNQILPNSLKNYNDGAPLDTTYKKTSDTLENDDVNYPPIYDLPFFNNVLRTMSPPPNENPPEENVETSSFTLTFLIITGFVFLLINVIVFGVILYQRGKLRVRENLFQNRFRCKTISVPDIFEENGTNDIYAIAERKKEEMAEANKKSSHDKGKKASAKSKSSKMEDDYNTLRVASVNPEAMSGKRMRRWPLSRQCSGSTISMDPHSKVRNWITQEIAKCSPRFLRRCRRKNTQTKEKRKVSVAIDATPAARTGSVLKQIPIEMTKSLDNGKSALVSAPPQMRPSTSMSCIRKPKPTLQRSFAFTSEDSDEYYQKTGTHKSSAHIRLKTPEFFLDTMLPLAQTDFAVSGPSSSVGPNEMPLYSQVNKEMKRLKSFADSSRNASIEDSMESTSHYEDINVISMHEIPDMYCSSPTATTSSQLGNIKRRNFPKVLPDFPNAERKGGGKRLSLPCSGNARDKTRSRVPPAPPPRLTSTLGRKSSSDSDKQLSQIIVHLRKPDTSITSDEKHADIIQTESCNVPNTSETVNAASEVKHIPPGSSRVDDGSGGTVKSTRSVTTSTSGIPVPKLVPYTQKDDEKSS